MPVQDGGKVAAIGGVGHAGVPNVSYTISKIDLVALNKAASASGRKSEEARSREVDTIRSKASKPNF